LSAWGIVFVLLPVISWAADERNAYIDNGKIRLGVDLESGGSIFYLSQSAPLRNLLNHFDRGRFIQQSYYGDGDGSHWADKEWRWNPVQGGDYKGNPAVVIEYANMAGTLYVKSMPKHWATGVDIVDAAMEQWISLTGDIAHIRYKFTYSGAGGHAARHQELPAVFVDYDLSHLVFYRGDNPWSHDVLTSKVPQWPNEYETRDEHWAAYVDDAHWGLGVYTPGTAEMTYYRYRGEKGPQGSGCSYFSPIRTLAITSGLVLEYDVYLTIGTTEEIRSRFYRVHALANAGE
jgi:hypothetical protein